MAFEEYLSAGVHIGMKQQTKDMKKFIYKVRPDGLAVLNVSLIDERIKIAAKFLSRYKKIMVISRKGVGQRPAKKFGQLTGTEYIIGRFLPGTITNPDFPGYFEPDIIVITDPLIDKQALTEAVKMRIPVVALCDTFNETSLVDLVIPCNNKGRKAIARIYYLLAREYLKSTGKISSDDEFDAEPEAFEAKRTKRPAKSKPVRRRRRR